MSICACDVFFDLLFSCHDANVSKYKRVNESVENKNVSVFKNGLNCVCVFNPSIMCRKLSVVYIPSICICPDIDVFEEVQFLIRQTTVLRRNYM